MTLPAISLFSGIGGMDIAFAAAEFDIIAQVEINDFCQRILQKHKRYWPNAKIFADVRDFGRHSLSPSIANNIACIFGGAPCQPFSVAGNQQGESDHRNLWPEFRRIIGEIRPRSVLLENVPNIVGLYGTIIVGDLTALGYDCKWDVISAADAGAPHLRKRWWLVAYAKTSRLAQRRHRPSQNPGAYRKAPENQPAYRPHRAGRIVGRGQPAQPPLGGAVDGLSAWLDQPRWPAGQGAFQYPFEAPRTIPSGQDPYRKDRVEALGNAVVPQCVFPLALGIKKELEKMNEK